MRTYRIFAWLSLCGFFILTALPQPQIVGGAVPCTGTDWEEHKCQTFDPLQAECTDRPVQEVVDNGGLKDVLGVYQWVCTGNNCVNVQLDKKKSNVICDQVEL